ncbi:MAG: ATP-binding protein [Selenomonadaceae bacterium]
MRYIKRHLESYVERADKSFKSLLVTGARQVGKSTLLRHVFPERAYLTFDDPMILTQARTEPGLFFRNHPYPVTLDEVQYIQELFPYIKIACDETDDKGLFSLTGSQSFHLMKHVSESLAGRIAILELAGLSLREIDGVDFTAPFIPSESYIHQREKFYHPHKDIWDIIHRGSYPALYEDGVDWQMFYSSYVQTYLSRDLNDIMRVKDHMKFMRFLSAMAARTGQLLNYSNVAEQADISSATAKEWTSVLEASGIIYILQPFSNSALTRAIKTPKLYFRDTGLACFLTRYPTTETAMNGAMAGAFFETFVVSEILKSFANAGIDYRMNVTYYRGKDKNEGKESEIDLIIEDGDTIYPIEIKMSANPKLSMTNSFDVIDKIKKRRRGIGAILCMYDKPLWLSENTIALPVEYI